MLLALGGQKFPTPVTKEAATYLIKKGCVAKRTRDEDESRRKTSSQEFKFIFWHPDPLV